VLSLVDDNPPLGTLRRRLAEEDTSHCGDIDTHPFEEASAWEGELERAIEDAEKEQPASGRQDQRYRPFFPCAKFQVKKSG
jgi:hypothetical protein